MTILIAYATRAGSTREVADYLADVVREHGHEAVVKPAAEVRDVRPYSGVIVGSAVRMGNILPEAVNMMKRIRGQLGTIPTAYFAVCLSIKEDLPKEHAKIRQSLAKMSAIHAPISTALFAGKVDFSKLNWFFRMVLSKGEKAIPEGDWRDWAAIKQWGESILPSLA